MEILDTTPAYPPDQMVQLDADKLAVVLRTLQDQGRDLLMLHNLVKDATPLQREIFRNVLYMNEARLVQLCKLTGVELETEAEHERRHEGIRRANLRVRELERLLGEGGTPQQTAAHLKVLNANLQKWWRSDGFGYVRKVSFSEYGHVHAQLSCNLFGSFSLTNSATPVTDKENKASWLKSLAERGFVLHTEPDEREPELLDCDATRKALMDTLSKALPSAKITKTENHRSRSGQMRLNSVDIIVYDLADVQEIKLTSGWTLEE